VINRLLPALLLMLLAGCASTSNLRPFATDGCSLFPDRSARTGKDWGACCVTHDRAYWRGGGKVDRRVADKELRMCVLAKTDSKGLSSLMYRGVRIGGMPYLPTPFRWGYGWGYGRFYRKLDDQEKAAADQLQAQYDASH
jgi:hypothetical protein